MRSRRCCSPPTSEGRWWRASTRRMRGGGHVDAVSDITDLKRSQEAYLAVLAEEDLMLDTLPVGVAFVESGNIEVLEANKTGLVTALRRGESAVLVRFEGNYAATTITCMGDRSGFVWKDQPVNNYIDELVDAKLKIVKTSASGLCTDGYTEFCCTINNGINACPPGSFAGGWWRAMASSAGSGSCCSRSTCRTRCSSASRTGNPRISRWSSWRSPWSSSATASASPPT